MKNMTTYRIKKEKFYIFLQVNKLKLSKINSSQQIGQVVNTSDDDMIKCTTRWGLSTIYAVYSILKRHCLVYLSLFE